MASRMLQRYLSIFNKRWRQMQKRQTQQAPLPLIDCRFGYFAKSSIQRKSHSKRNGKLVVWVFVSAAKNKQVLNDVLEHPLPSRVKISIL